MAQMKKKTIFLVDDEPAVLEAIGESLRQVPGCQVEAFEDAETCLERLQGRLCHLLISDVNLPGMDGIRLLQEVKRIHPRLAVLLITGYGDIPMAVRALKSGAADFIEKPLDEEFFLSVVQDHLDDHEVHERIQAKALTRTEVKILKQIVQGRTNKEIAFDLNRSTRTIENHRHRLMKKLDATSTAELVKSALTLGMVTPEE